MNCLPGGERYDADFLKRVGCIHMLRHLAAFVRLLRRAGIPVAQGEFLDMVRALELLEPSRENVLLAMRAALVKDCDRQRVLESLFNVYFSSVAREEKEERDYLPPAARLGERRSFSRTTPEVSVALQTADAVDGRRGGPPRLSAEEFAARLAVLKDWLRRELDRAGAADAAAGSCRAQGRGGAGAGRSGGGHKLPFVQRYAREHVRSVRELYEVLKEGNDDALAALAQNAVDALSGVEPGGETPAEMLRRLKAYLHWDDLEDSLDREPGINEAVRLRRRESLNRLTCLLRRELERREEFRWELPKLADGENLYERAFDNLDALQVEEIKRILVRFGRRLAARPGYRYAPARRGSVDMRRTVRLAAAGGGIPLVIRCRTRPPGRPELVTLCDFSGSVAPYSRFMLLLIYAMQTGFRRVRSFAFVDAVAEITGYLKTPDLERAMRAIIRQTGIWRTGFSDYGAVWEQFYREHINAVDTKTTVLVLGDARNNYRPPGVDFFREICRRARRVIWLNPAPEEKWDREDSIMHLYAPYCRRVFPCRNLAQLERIARAVF